MKNRKIYLSESQIKGLKSIGLQEIIDADGSLISGDEISNEKTIKTNTIKPDGRPQTSDDFAKETGKQSDMYLNRYGFSITEGEDALTEADDFVSNNAKPSGFMDKNSKIPETTELSKSYKKPDIQSSLNDLIRKITQNSIEKELQQDINAIVLKGLLSSVNFSNMKPQHKKEIQNMLK
jgi:hypothetical protein